MRLFLLCLILCFTLGSIGAFASGVVYNFDTTNSASNPPASNTIQKPNPGSPSNFNGTDCHPGDTGCIIAFGSVQAFEPISATLSQATPGGPWTLTFETFAPKNYFDATTGTTFPDNAFGDALFKSYDNGTTSGNPIYWGLSLGSYTENLAFQNAGLGLQMLTAGGLYKANAGTNYPNTSGDGNIPGGSSMYLMAGSDVSGAVPPILDVTGGRTNEPVWVNPANMTLVGSPTGTGFSVTTEDCPANADVGCNKLPGQGSFALYTITDTFNAPANFLLNGVFSFEVASFVCANGLIIGTGATSSVPEPRALFLILPAILFLGRRFARSRNAQV